MLGSREDDVLNQGGLLAVKIMSDFWRSYIKVSTEEVTMRDCHIQKGGLYER